MSKKSTTSTIKYNGSVKIKALNGTKVVKSTKVHNDGTQWFFQVLASAVLGNDERNNMPHYLDIFEEDNDKIISNRVPLTAKSFRSYTDQDTGYTGVLATFTAIIPYKSISDQGNPHTIKYIRIYSNSTEDTTTLAQVTIPPEEEDKWTLPANTRNNIAVEWDMFFTTKVTEEQTSTSNGGES